MGNSCGRADAARRIARRPTVGASYLHNAMVVSVLFVARSYFPSPSSTESSVEAAAPVLSTIHSLAASCDGALTSSLDANTTAATSRATVAASATICTIQETVHAYVASVRRRARAALKQLEAREEECVDTIKSLESCVQQLLANDGCVEFLEGSLEAVARILDSADVFPRVSTVITSAAHSPSLLLDYVRSGMSRIDNGIDPTHCKVIYPRWLLRKVSNMVTISLCDVVGQPVYGVTPSDVSVSISSEAVGCRQCLWWPM